MAVSSLSAVHVVTMTSKIQDRPNLDIHNVLTSRRSDFQPLPQIYLHFPLAVSLYPTRVVVKSPISSSTTCRWNRRVLGNTGKASLARVMAHVKGCLVQNYKDVLDCLTESPCRVEDNRLQMLVLRDPHAVVVSSYFWILTHPNQGALIRTNESLEQ